MFPKNSPRNSFLSKSCKGLSLSSDVLNQQMNEILFRFLESPSRSEEAKSVEALKESVNRGQVGFKEIGIELLVKA